MENNKLWYISDFQKLYQNKITNKTARTQHKCPLKNCVECKTVWQYDWSNSKRKFVQYEDMPKYGLEKQICDKCKKKEGYLYERNI
tara:strand:- start:21875 stop:22132 length:258 start_codon:yes stop_codon:yes gene_type:complete